MFVVAIPDSHFNKKDFFDASANIILDSLVEFNPEVLGLPPFY